MNYGIKTSIFEERGNKAIALTSLLTTLWSCLYYSSVELSFHTGRVETSNI